MTATKPIRLDLLAERRDKRGWLKQNAVYIIRDGTKRISTGCGPDDRLGAEKVFGEYLVDRHKKTSIGKARPAAEVPVADVIGYYLERSQDVARPKELLRRTTTLLAYWGSRMLSDVDGHHCEEYVRQRGSRSSARRELEDLSAAIGLFVGNGRCREHIVVTLPKKSEAREKHFSREQIAALLYFCLTYRTTQRGRKTKHRSLRHLVPFILTAVYTGSRSARVWNASYEKEPGRPWIDLDHGIFYRVGDAEKRYDNKRADPIPIPERLLRHMRWWQKQGCIVADKETGKRVRKPTHYLVEWQGRPADPKKGLTFAMDQVFGEGHGFVRHSFRHTCATWLIEEGKHTEEEIAAYMSMTVQMLRKVYGHPHPDRHRKIAESFSMGTAGRRQRNPRGNRYGRGDTKRETEPA
ncbi:site-specific integrase [Aureimonas psammosilenae]|uniref:integrase n=1 Tax=Aureimonas psammosilenae TaxID=2495496 RepID=UPI001260B007|nr:integrase [Aureimonas psammosilenae]